MQLISNYFKHLYSASFVIKVAILLTEAFVLSPFGDVPQELAMKGLEIHFSNVMFQNAWSIYQCNLQTYIN